MREVKLLKNLPWLVLFFLLATGTSLWLLFVAEQQSHLRTAFQNQLERLADELLRGRLEGLLGPTELPEDVRAFAIYDARGQRLADWGEGSPASIDLSVDWRRRSVVERQDEHRTIGLIRALQPLGPRMGLWDNEDRGNDNQPRRPMPGRRNQGFLFVSVDAQPLEARTWAWFVGGLVGVAAWAGFLAFIGVLWFRTRRYQTALVQHRELLQFAEASRTLSHELQNPLAAILLQTALLKRAAGDTPPAEVAIIEEEARRMSTLVSRVRDFLKDPQGQAERVDLAELTASLRGRFAVAVGYGAEPPTPYTVKFDPHRLRSVVENLLKNAVESGPDPRPEVRLSRPRAGWVRLEVLDSGAGFTAESLQQARNPFFTTKTTGTGIGLSITDSFVGAAGGKLKLENRPEGGARVSLDLPEAPEEKP